MRGFEPVSLCDWPGHVCAVLFLGGCNLLCPTCHNHQLAWKPTTVPTVPRADILGYLQKKSRWLDGITVTGGEPSIVPGLASLLAELRGLGLPIKMDSNGMRPDVISGLLEKDLVQAFAVDVKGPWHEYKTLTALERIFDLAKKHPARFYFRCTQVPGISDADLEIVRGQLPAGFSLRVQTFIPPLVSDRSQDARRVA